MGVGASWLSGLGAAGGDNLVASWLFVCAVVACGCGIGLEWCGAGAMDAGWLGSSIDRAGTAVCLVWLVLFEVVFFAGCAWV
jgi:hypothetical protein